MSYYLLEDQRTIINRTLFTNENIQYHLFNKGLPYMYYVEVGQNTIKDIKDLPLWDNYNFCEHVIKTYKSKIYIRNEEAKKLEFPEERYNEITFKQYEEKSNEELWAKYIKIYDGNQTLKEQVIDMYKHFSVEECKELYHHYRWLLTKIYNDHGSKQYCDIQKYLASYGIKYSGEDDYYCSFMYGDLHDNHSALIHGLMYNSQSLIDEIIFTYMGINKDDKLDYFKPFDTTHYDKDYFIENHIIDGKVTDIKIKYSIITYEEMLYLQDFCKN